MGAQGPSYDAPPPASGPASLNGVAGAVIPLLLHQLAASSGTDPDPVAAARAWAWRSRPLHPRAWTDRFGSKTGVPHDHRRLPNVQWC
jgi:hypothetical protein